MHSLTGHPRLEVLYGARYSPHDNPVGPIAAALNNYVANTAVNWPDRLGRSTADSATAHPARC